MIDNFSWVIPDKLAGMAMPTGVSYGSDAMIQSDLEELRSSGVGCIFSVKPMERRFGDLCTKAGLRWLYYPIDNFDTPRDAAAFDRVMGRALDTIRSGVAVCVHCYAGIGRTGLVLACLAGKLLGAPPAEAVRLVRSGREAFDTEEQVRFVHAYLKPL